MQIKLELEATQMFIVYLRNGNFGLFKSSIQGNPTLIAECESYSAVEELMYEMEA